MIAANAYAAYDETTPLAPYNVDRRELGENDVLIDIKFCGVCHSDIHQVKNEWGNSMYPMVPGHEIVGVISRVGSKVTKFREGDLAGIGCFVDSCRTCSSCQEGLEQYCEVHNVGTYNSYELDKKTVTYGGYSSQIVVDENYTLRVPESLDLAGVAPLLCAGITTYSPILEWKIGEGHRVGIVGLGGLGHMATKIAAAKGAEVTVLSTSPNKAQDARDLGANNFAVTSDADTLKELKSSFDFIIDTVSAPHDYNLYLSMLKRDGTMIILGVPPEPSAVAGFSLIPQRRRIAGSMIGGIKETQEMLDFCAEHNITADIELISIKEINTAYERMLRNDVKYRFVIDMATL